MSGSDTSCFPILAFVDQHRAALDRDPHRDKKVSVKTGPSHYDPVTADPATSIFSPRLLIPSTRFRKG